MIIKKIKAKKFSLAKNIDSIRIILKTDNGKFESWLGLDNITYSKESLKKDINFINKILKEKIRNLEVKKIEEIQILDDLIKKENPGINKTTIVVVQQAILKALNKENLWKLINKDVKQVPRPMGVIIGSTSSRLSPDFKQFLLFSFNSSNFTKAVDANLRIHDILERTLREHDKNFRGELNEEQAFATNLSNFEVLDLLNKVCRQVSNEFKFDIKIGINVDARTLYKNSSYEYKNFSATEKNKVLSRKEQTAFIISLVNKYDLCYVEDPLEENDFKGFSEIKKYTNCLVCGNKLIHGKIENLNKAIKDKSINSAIVNLNDLGSINNLVEFTELCKEKKIHLVIGEYFYETKDNIIAHIATGYGIPVIKYGIYGKSRTSKLDEIKFIEKQIKEISNS